MTTATASTSSSYGKAQRLRVGEMTATRRRCTWSVDEREEQVVKVGRRRADKDHRTSSTYQRSDSARRRPSERTGARHDTNDDEEVTQLSDPLRWPHSEHVPAPGTGLRSCGRQTSRIAYEPDYSTLRGDAAEHERRRARPPA